MNFVCVCELNGIVVDDVVVYDDLVVFVIGGSIWVWFYCICNVEVVVGNLLVVFIYGGGWVIGSVDMYDGICCYFVCYSGCLVVLVEYW